jgi:gluconolactonase
MTLKVKAYSALMAAALLSIWACQPGNNQNKTMSEKATTSTTSEKVYPTTGSITRADARLDAVIKPEATIEILTEGFAWSEGPVWLPGQNKLLFSDIPPNSIYEWSEEGGKKLYLKPSGYTGQTPRGGEPGSNGLILNSRGQLVLCQHGDRRMARMDAPLGNPKPAFITLADKYEGKRFNSPNDAVYKSNGDLYFTDPPYGLEKNADDPAKEIPFQGVYRLGKDGRVYLLTQELSRPNGLAFSPDEKILYVGNSDPQQAIWMAYDVTEFGSLTRGRVFYDATPLVSPEAPGLPDGLKVNRQGYLFATGPGGILVLNSKAEHLGTIKTGQPTANCAFNEDESVLYITANNYLMRVRLK